MPATELESLVMGRLNTFLASGRAVLDAVGAPDNSAAIRKTLTAARRALAVDLPKAPASVLRGFLLTTVARITLAEQWFNVTLWRRSFRAVLLGAPPRRRKSQAISPGKCVSMNTTRRISFTFASRRRCSEAVRRSALSSRRASPTNFPRGATSL